MDFDQLDPHCGGSKCRIDGSRVIGKPNRAYFELALDDLGLPAADVAMIGDDVHTDINGGHAAGLKTILVKTGRYAFDDLSSIDCRPDWTLDSSIDLDDRKDWRPKLAMFSYAIGCLTSGMFRGRSFGDLLFHESTYDRETASKVAVAPVAPKAPKPPALVG